MRSRPKAPFGWKHVRVVTKNQADKEGLQCCDCGVVYVGRIQEECFDPHDCQKTPQVERLDSAVG